MDFYQQDGRMIWLRPLVCGGLRSFLTAATGCLRGRPIYSSGRSRLTIDEDGDEKSNEVPEKIIRPSFLNII